VNHNSFNLCDLSTAFVNLGYSDGARLLVCVCVCIEGNRVLTYPAVMPPIAEVWVFFFFF
jgi:hypothetical protein